MNAVSVKAETGRIQILVRIMRRDRVILPSPSCRQRAAFMLWLGPRALASHELALDHANDVCPAGVGLLVTAVLTACTGCVRFGGQCLKRREARERAAPQESDVRADAGHVAEVVARQQNRRL